jgi:hypothetical protein
LVLIPRFVQRETSGRVQDAFNRIIVAARGTQQRIEQKIKKKHQ